jgi:aryl-alcohol dehydrogenase-like predicted oxidoreductase
VNYREVGGIGIRVSEVGFGCGGNAGLMVRGTFEQQREAIARALELGVNYFDLAPDYGNGAAEESLGRVLRELGVRPYITTKVEVRAHNLDDIAGHVTRSLDESLKRLRIDYVDFLQIHNGPVMDRPELSGRTYSRLWIEDYLRPGGALDGLRRAQRDGKARFIGFITRGNDAPAAQRLIDTGAFSLINVSVSLLNPSAAIKPDGLRIDQDYGGILSYAAAHGVGAAIYSPLVGGVLTDSAVAGGPGHPLARGPRSPEAWTIPLRQAKALSFLSRGLDPESREQHDLAEAAIRFILSLGGVTTVLGGFSEKKQVEEITACSGKGPLSVQNMTRIEMVWRANFGLSE